MKDTDKETDTFENTYPKYPFSELVRISLKLTGFLVAHCSKAGRMKLPHIYKFLRTQDD
jgi:hypothetical protein